MMSPSRQARKITLLQVNLESAWNDMYTVGESIRASVPTPKEEKWEEEALLK